MQEREGRMKAGLNVKCFLLLVGFSLNAQAELLLDYTPPANEQTPLYAHSPGVPTSYASSFTVGPQDVEVTSIWFRLDGLSPMSYDFTGYLFENAVDRPGNILGSADRHFASGELVGLGLASYEFGLGSSVILVAGTTYWVGIGTSSAGYPPYIAYTSDLSRFDDRGVAPSLTHATSGTYPPTTPWSVNAPTITLVYEIEGTVIPEPTAGALCIVGVSILGLSLRRMRIRRPSLATPPLVIQTSVVPVVA